MKEIRKHKTRAIDKQVRLEHEKKKLEARSLADAEKLESVQEELEHLDSEDDEEEIVSQRKSVRSSKPRLQQVRSEPPPLFG